MKVDLGIWGKLTWAVIILGLVAGLGLVANFYLPLINQNEKFRADIANLNVQIAKEEQEARALKAAIESVRRNPERVAREKLGLAKPDEVVIRFVDPSTNGRGSR